jgi:hypothetical protein
MQGIDLEKLCFIIAKAREFHAKVEPADVEPGSSPSDDAFRDVLLDYADDPTCEELHDALLALNEEEMRAVLALIAIGRGDFGSEEWDEALAEAEEIAEDEAPDYVIGTPLVADYLEEALSQFGYSCADAGSG